MLLQWVAVLLQWVPLQWVVIQEWAARQWVLLQWVVIQEWVALQWVVVTKKLRLLNL